MNFVDKVKKRIAETGNHVCIGLDSDYAKIPVFLKESSSVSQTIFEFNKHNIDATHSFAAAYKSNLVFYAGYGSEGLAGLLKTNEYLKKVHPEIQIIADGKRSEMGFTARLAAKEIFEEFLFDAMTVTPWFGEDTIDPYRTFPEKAVFVLCHDSNPSAGDLQDLELKNGEKLYTHLTKLVVNTWNTSGNILVEAPLTYPDILKEIYQLCDDRQLLLVAGLGAQGGTIADLALFKQKKNFIVNASRSIIFASEGVDFAEQAGLKAKEFAQAIQQILS